LHHNDAREIGKKSRERAENEQNAREFGKNSRESLLNQYICQLWKAEKEKYGKLPYGVLP
jgi:hypothetical protein